MSELLRGWLDQPHPGRGVHLADDIGGWDHLGYAELASAAKRTATGLIADGVRPGDVVCVLMPTGFPCITGFFAVWAAGAAVCLIPPPAFVGEDDYVAHVGRILAQARPRLLVTSPELESFARRALSEADLAQEPWLHRESETEAELQPAGELALVQFTSGSSGTPRGVRVTWANLAANIELIRSWIDWRDGDQTASWLPLYHDMGLIGCLLTPVCGQGDLWLMRPVQFIRDPGRWLECFTFAQHTAAPPFAFDYLTRRVRPERLSTLDLSGWRSAIVGAEPIDPDALERFTELASPAGFSPTAYLPAYGLAEATLAVSAHTTDEAPPVIRPDSASLKFGETVVVEQKRRLGDPTSDDEGGWLVGCGRATGVRILDEDGAVLDEGRLGEIEVHGPSVAVGYRGGHEHASTRFVDDAVRTGDAGFVHEGQLYVLGRMGDSLKVRGRSVYVEDLEAKVSAATRMRRGRFAVVSTARSGIALFAEAADGGWIDDASTVLRNELGPDVAISIVIGSSGLIRKTSSGKPKRRHMWEQFQAGALTGARVAR
ncbi:AMP-binding protein [Allokutzneria oryzae]|uniref:AMP-binding protein n=1 Tax=Allokutzneria oryzae TaxID=1378989 RepID=A0ABV5ZTW0_9PSEU